MTKLANGISLVALAPLVFLSGCASMQSNQAGANFGEAYREIFAAQIKNPHPVHDTNLRASGVHAAEAVRRYRTGGDSGGSDFSPSGTGSSSSGSGTASGSSNSDGNPFASRSAPPAKPNQSGSSLPPNLGSAGVIDPQTGKFFPKAGDAGIVDPQTGKFFPKAGPNGYIDPASGKFIPAVP